MLAANKISKLQKEKRAQSAGSRPKSAGRSGRPATAGGRPTSAGTGRPKSAGQGRPATAIGTRPASADASAARNTYEDRSQSPDNRPSSAASNRFEERLDVKYEIEDSTDGDRIQEWSRADYSDDSDDVMSESFPEVPRPSSSAASSSKNSPESSMNRGIYDEARQQRPTSASTNRYKRPATGARRKSQSAAGKRRPNSATGQRRGSTSSQKRPARRMETKYARRVYKQEVKQAQKPNLEGSCMTRAKALWIMFVMSFLPKVLTAIGLIVCMLGIIMMGIGSNAEANYPEGKSVGAVMFVLGFVSVVVGLIALKVRRREKKKMRGHANEQAKQKYAVNGVPNGNISIISKDIDMESDFPPRQKTSFTTVENEETGFTNLAAVIDDYHLPGSPDRRRRRQSVEATMQQWNVSSSGRNKEQPEMLIVPNPTTGSKSHGGKNVKKSKTGSENGKIPTKLSTLSEIPEVIVTGPTPRENYSPETSPRSNNSTPKSIRKSTDNFTTSPVSSPRSPSKGSSPRSPRPDNNGGTPPSPAPSHKSLRDEDAGDMSSSPLTARKSPTHIRRSPSPIHKNPPTSQNIDKWDDSDDEFGVSKNKTNEKKEAQNGKLNAMYKNMGFEEDDIVPEDL